MKRFPVGKYGRQQLSFFPAPYRAPLRSFAVLVFAWKDDKVVVCDISHRGWSVPSGRVEHGETSLEAARREAFEEAGLQVSELNYMGCYQVRDRKETRWVDAFSGLVESMTPIQPGGESRAVRLVTMAELAEIYHLWNDLTKIVFEYSRESLNLPVE
ncbi:MAG: NUDIX hydrolase [Fimbriimonadaceae bacterium]|nr:MAG: ADP-ribose pyrophosphatase [Armatimonadetes bacterium OLB18]MCZ7580981.1 NUDIX hydrolase [Fimbriimonadaceae bacterium]WKZ80468.1 MAG: NUDIX hydrolase [Fimbriimonadaceae bacterium]